MKKDLYRNEGKENLNAKGFFKLKNVAVVVFIMTLAIMRFTNLGDKGLIPYSGDTGTLDMMFHYSYQYAYGMLNGLGDTGRSIYLRFFIIDIIFILSFAVVQAEIIKYLVRKAVLPFKWNRLSLLSYIRGMFDILENLFLAVTLIRFSTGSTAFIRIAGIMTTSKWVVFILSIATMTVLLLMAILRPKIFKKAE